MSLSRVGVALRSSANDIRLGGHDETFWNAFNEEHEGDWLTLAELVRVLDTRWRAHKASDWDREVLSTAAQRLSLAAQYQGPVPKVGKEEAEKIKNRLLGVEEEEEHQEDQAIGPEDIQKLALVAVNKALEEYAASVLDESRKSDKKDISLESYDNILQRAIQSILGGEAARRTGRRSLGAVEHSSGSPSDREHQGKVSLGLIGRDDPCSLCGGPAGSPLEVRTSV